MPKIEQLAISTSQVTRESSVYFQQVDSHLRAPLVLTMSPSRGSIGDRLATLNREMSAPRAATTRFKCIPHASSKDACSSGCARSNWSVNIECRLAADTRRIFNALTVPEYMETWICLPDAPPDCRVQVSGSANGFQIEDPRASGTATRITGSYLSFLTRKLSFSWSFGSTASNMLSTVDIRLCGDFDKSVLRLRHRGFDLEHDVKWHAALWFASVTRLARLFDPSA